VSGKQLGLRFQLSGGLLEGHRDGSNSTPGAPGAGPTLRAGCSSILLGGLGPAAMAVDRAEMCPKQFLHPTRAQAGMSEEAGAFHPLTRCWRWKLTAKRWAFVRRQGGAGQLPGPMLGFALQRRTRPVGRNYLLRWLGQERPPAPRARSKLTRRARPSPPRRLGPCPHRSSPRRASSPRTIGVERVVRLGAVSSARFAPSASPGTSAGKNGDA